MKRFRHLDVRRATADLAHMLFSRWLGERAGRVHKLLLAALLFWFFSYLIMSIRGTVTPVPLPVLSARRLLSTFSGAALFTGSALMLLRMGPQSVLKRAAFVLLASLVSTACLFAIQAAAERIADWSPPITAGDQVGWLLMWAGYFAAWLTGTLSVLGDERRPATEEQLPEPAAQADADPQPGTLWVQQNRETIRVPIREIEWIEAEGNYARIHAARGKGLVRASLRSLQGQLAGEGFIRVHRSALCRRDSIRSLRRSGGNLKVVLDSGSEVAVGRAYAADVSSGLNL